MDRRLDAQRNSPTERSEGTPERKCERAALQQLLPVMLPP
jgi:hypothetical protein